jgi:hypothetical protein
VSLTSPASVCQRSWRTGGHGSGCTAESSIHYQPMQRWPTSFSRRRVRRAEVGVGPVHPTPAGAASFRQLAWLGAPWPPLALSSRRRGLLCLLVAPLRGRGSGLARTAASADRRAASTKAEIAEGTGGRRHHLADGQVARRTGAFPTR